MSNLISFQSKFANEQSCIDYLAKLRWDDEPVCPHCGGKAWKFKTRSLYKCQKCDKQFTVRIGTIFEESRLPLQKWFLAIYLLTSLKSGLSSIQLSKYLGITQKTAWFMLQRIRWALDHDFKLKDIVEADETFMGGKEKNRHSNKKKGYNSQTPVFGAVERKGRVRAKKIDDVSKYTLHNAVRESLEKGSVLFTDEHVGYQGLKDYDHATTCHNKGEYVCGDAHTNTIEGFWSQLKRGLRAVYIRTSEKHLNKYCDEYCFRYNTREMNDFDRFEFWFGLCGKRLTYKTLIA